MAVAPRLYRVILPVNDLDAAVSFYAALLEEPGMRVSKGRHYFSCGGVIMALYDPHADGDDRTPRPNFDYVYFAVDDLEAVYGRAQKVGGLSTATGDGRLPMGAIARRPWGERSFYMNDPFGNPICFVDAASVFTGQGAPAKDSSPDSAPGVTTTIYVSNLDRSVDFYTGVLGLRLGGRWGDEYASIDLGRGSSIGLHPSRSPHSPRPGTPGSIQVGIGVNRPLDDVVNDLKARGVAFRGPIKDDTQVRLAFFGDPDGNDLYLVETRNWS
jgi:catechol 2,3-dioxygenase-like lactoylglutathione lyase family enzyme